MEGIKEDEEKAFNLPEVSAATTTEDICEEDNVSLMSHGSTIYTPEQRRDVIARFSRVVIKNLPTNSNFYSASDSSRQHVLPHLRSALKTFVEMVHVDHSTTNHAKALKMVRRLRSEISQELQDSMLNITQDAEKEHIMVNLGENTTQMDLSDIIGHWNTALTDENHIAPVSQEQVQSEQNVNSNLTFSSARADSLIESRESQVSEAHGDDTFGLYGESIDPGEILNQFTEQPAFNAFVKTTEHLFEQYHSQKLDLIRHRISLTLRCSSARRGRYQSPSKFLRVVFNVDWNLKDFLNTNYDAGIHQKLGQILAVTSQTDKARLCSVGEYFKWCWPKYKAQLLEAIEIALSTTSTGIVQTPHQPPTSSASGSVTVDPTLGVFTVTGTEDFLVSVGQQISLLAAICQQKQDRLSCAYVGFFESSESHSSDLATFDISVRLESPSTKNCTSCWNVIVGPAILATGFPIPDRKYDEQGLEVSLPVMAALAGIPQAVNFGDGPVFKGRCHALVPTADLGSSIQWHLIDTYPQKLAWSHIDKACPTRLRGQQMNTAFWSRRCFLGWCPRASELLGEHLSDQMSSALVDIDIQ
jgi:hypothetical protein